MGIRPALLFDLDGTLINSAADLTTAVNCLRHDDGLAPLPVAEVAGMVGDGVRILVSRALPRECQRPDSVGRFLAYYQQHLCDQTLPYPGVPELLREFRSHAKAVVTNKPLALTHEILARLGLSDAFLCVVGGDSYAEKNPHPLPVLKSLEIMRCPPRDAVMIGDHHTDLDAGREAGCRTCFCNWGLGNRGEAIPCWEVSDAGQLAKLLRDLRF